MRRIWEDVREKVNQCFTEGQQLSRQRDNDIVAMLTDEQKAKFEKISKDYHDRWLRLGDVREQAFNKGVEETNKILDEAQQKKYAEILSKRLGHAPSPSATEPSDGPLVSPLPPAPMPAPSRKN